MMLAMQMGFAARNAVQAYDLAALGLTAPVNILDGRCGFFRNFEADNILPHALAHIGKPWKVTQLSHKRFPSGRVTHGSLYTLRQLQAELGLKRGTIAQDLKRITVQLPPLACFWWVAPSSATHRPTMPGCACLTWLPANCCLAMWTRAAFCQTSWEILR